MAALMLGASRCGAEEGGSGTSGWARGTTAASQPTLARSPGGKRSVRHVER